MFGAPFWDNSAHPLVPNPHFPAAGAEVSESLTKEEGSVASARDSKGKKRAEFYGGDREPAEVGVNSPATFYCSGCFPECWETLLNIPALDGSLPSAY